MFICLPAEIRGNVWQGWDSDLPFLSPALTRAGRPPNWAECRSRSTRFQVSPAHHSHGFGITNLFLQRQITIHSCKMRRVGHKIQSLCLRWECLKQSVQLPADQRACPGVALCGCCDRRAPAGFWHPRLVTEAMPCEVTQACHQSGGSEMGKEPRPPRQPLCRGLHGYCEVCTAWPSCSGLGAACSEEA